MILGFRLFIFSETCKNLLVESQIYPNFPVIANFHRYSAEFLFSERRRMKIFRSNGYVNASYEWPILEQFMGKCCQSCGTSQWWWLAFKKHNTKPTRELMQTSCFRTIFCSLPVRTCEVIIDWTKIFKIVPISNLTQSVGAIAPSEVAWLSAVWLRVSLYLRLSGLSNILLLWLHQFSHTTYYLLSQQQPRETERQDFHSEWLQESNSLSCLC